MKKVFAPHLNRHVILGGMKAPSQDAYDRAPRLKHFFKLLAGGTAEPTIPASPESVAWNGPAMSVLTNLEGNDEYGDCVLAEEAHYIAVITAWAGKIVAYTIAQTLAVYGILTGFNANDPSTDRGTDPITCLEYFTKNPYIDGSTNMAYLLVDATNKAEVEFALAKFGNLKLWLALPDSYVNPMPSRNGFVWDVDAPDPEQGHCISGVGYLSSGSVPQALQIVGVSALGIVVCTWGLLGTMTWTAAAALCVPAAGGGMATRVTKDWMSANGTTPSGLSMAQLIADFDLLGGTLPMPASLPIITPKMNWFQRLIHALFG
jgi:hypothetical protein